MIRGNRLCVIDRFCHRLTEFVSAETNHDKTRVILDEAREGSGCGRDGIVVLSNNNYSRATESRASCDEPENEFPRNMK